MTIERAGTVNTNVLLQNFGAVSPKQVAGFAAEVNRSTTSSNASLSQPSFANQTSEHVQDTPRSLPFVLATRPPINLGNPAGNPAGRQGTPLYDKKSVDSTTGSETKASTPMPTGKYETRGLIDGALDPKYDDKEWDNDEGKKTPLNINNPSGDKQLANLARSASHKAIQQEGMDGAKTDMMAQGSDGKDYRLSVRRNGRDTSVDITPMTRASDGKKTDAMMDEMKAKGIKIGNGFSPDEIKAVYDGFATLKGKDLDAMNGVTLERGKQKDLQGTTLQEGAEYANKKITFFDEAFKPGIIGNLPRGGATFLHEVGHRFDEVSGSRGKFQQTKGSAADITPYDGASKTLPGLDTNKEHYAEAYMLYKSDPSFMQQNYPDLFKFFDAQTAN